MKHLLICALALLSVAAGCDIIGFTYRDGFGFTLVQGGGPLAGALQLTDMNIPINQDVITGSADLSVADRLALSDLRIKGFTDSQIPADRDAYVKMFQDENTYSHCTDAPDMTWISKAGLYVVDQVTNNRAMIASFDKSVDDGDNLPCVLKFKVDENVNIKDFMPNFKVELEATGRMPVDNTQIGGYYGIKVVI